MIPRTIYQEEHTLFYQSVADYVKQNIVPQHAQWEKDHMVSRQAWKDAGEIGILGIQVPEAYGGLNIQDFRYNAIITEILGKMGVSGPGVGFQVHSDIVVPYILHYGSDEIKEQFLPGMVTGEIIGSICMSEPGAGSDLQRITTTAIDMGDHYLVEGGKTFISNGYQADMGVVAVKTDPKMGAKGTSLLAMDFHLEGVSKGIPFEKVGLHAQDTCQIFFDNVKVPKSALLGEVGKGFVYMMQELPQERLGLAIFGIASAEGALEETIQYVKDRKAFGKAVAEFQNTRFKLAELATEVAMGRVFIDRLVELHAEGKATAEMASMAKYSMSDLQCRVIDECLQLHGGYGYVWEYYIARAYADARVQRIYGGTNEIMKELISRKLLR
ncbi:MAG TPA: acyl-CoA dehydrogenase [Bacteroidetes bacterium]|nr:acyl-CoA dehydrogenase [Bacteroidota bacterium]